LTDLIDELTRKPRPTDRKSDESLLCISFWEREYSKAEEDYAEVTKTIALRENTERLQRILTRARQMAIERLGEAIVKDMNATLDSILEGHGIRISGIERSLLLEGQEGASQGQTLAVGYSFLSTLFARGQNELPFVVDAPALALDTRVAAEVGATLPQICPQFVGFIIDREREGFVPALERAAGAENLLYITAFADRPVNQELLEGLPRTGVSRVEQGVIVEGRDFFASAHFSGEESDG
jgi:DNA sulfur modification protein DndD